MSTIQFLLHIHKKDLFLLSTPTEVAFNTTNSPRFYCSSNPSQPSHSSALRTNSFGILLNLLSPPPPPPFPPPHWFLMTEDSPYQNLRANPCFLILGSDPPIAELEFWLAAHWATDLSTPNSTKSS